MDATASTSRQQRGLVLVKAKPNAFRHIAGDTFFVPSQSHAGGYVVDVSDIRVGGVGRCSCPDFQETRGVCKHQYALRYYRREIPMPDGSTVVTESIHISYPQHPSWTQAQCMELDIAQTLSRSLCAGIVTPPKVGRGPRRIPLSDVVHCAIMKVYRGLSGRRSSSDVRASADMGHISRAPAFNTVFKVVEDPKLTPLFRRLVAETARPLAAVETRFAVDATGFSTQTFAPTSWFEHKHHGDDTVPVHKWAKMHSLGGVHTNVIADAIVSSRGDSKEFAGMVERTIANGFRMEEMYADKAYSAHAHFDTMDSVGGMLYVPFRKGASGTTGHDLWDGLYHLYSLRRPVFNAHYNKRQNIESTFSGLKRKFGPALRSRKPAAQENEVYIKVVCWNISMLVHSIYELGIEPEFRKVAA